MTRHKKLKMPNGLLPPTYKGKPRETLLRVRHKMNGSQKVILQIKIYPKTNGMYLLVLSIFLECLLVFLYFTFQTFCFETYDDHSI